MTEIGEKLDKMEEAIKKPSFRQSSGKANEVNYWVFDYPPECELEVRERIARHIASHREFEMRNPSFEKSRKEKEA